jgi:hypothetical protein
MKPTKEQVNELTSRGIVPGARIKCAIDSSKGTVAPIEEWDTDGPGNSIAVGSDVYGYSDYCRRYATVVAPPEPSLTTTL